MAELQKLQQEIDALKLEQKKGPIVPHNDLPVESRCEEESKEANDYFELIFNTSPDAALITCLSDGVIVNLNNGFTKLTGYTPDDVLGKSSFEIDLWKQPSDRQRMIDELVKNDICDNFEAEFLRKDGSSLVGLLSAKIVSLNGIGHIISTTRDITERKQYDETLQKSEEKFHALYSNMVEGMALHELVFNNEGAPEDYLILDINPAFEKILSITRDSVIGKLSREVYQVPDPPFFNVYSQVALTGKAQVFETYFEPLNKYFSISVYQTHENGFATVFEDISERKQAEAALQENRNFLNILLDSIPVPVFYKDRQGRYLGCNLAYESFIGKTKEEFIGKTVFDISGPELAQIYHDKDQELFDKIGVQIYESQVRNATDELRDVIFKKATLVDLNGNITGIVGAIMDLTEHKKAEKALKLSEKKYRLIADNVSDVIWQMDAETHLFTYISPSVERLTGYKVEEVLQYPFEWMLTPKSQKLIERIIPILLSSYKHGEYETLIYEVEHPCINGTTVWTETSTQYLIDEETGRLMAFGSARDITNRKKAENEIMLKNEELQKLNAQKDKFFSIIAHDLKSPFNSIVGFSELLVEEVTEKNYEEIQKYAKIILQSSERAMDLLINLMEWTRAQTGRMEFNPEHVELVDLINQIILLFRDIAGQKSIKIKKILPSSAPVYCDKAMISTVIRNLVSNAIKFSNPGSEITISLDQDTKEFILIIRDHGVGIPRERVEKLFQIDKSISTEGTNHEQGTGLGLILCKEFVEKHGGTIQVKSELGKGSDFIISIPWSEQ